MKPRVLIVKAPGTNCDEETAHAFRLAGGAPDIVHVNRLLGQPRLFADYQVCCLPGGFSYGDDIAAGRILANQVRHHLQDSLVEFQQAGKLILGICNGFQVLIQCSLFWPEERAPWATLTWNDPPRFQDRWVGLRTEGRQCVFLNGVRGLELPIAHAEGKLVFADGAAGATLSERGQLPLRYVTAAAKDTAPPVAADAVSAEAFLGNPNGSALDVAGLCDPSGRVFGLMPHPERFVHRTQHPQWTRRDLPENGAGLTIFRNAVNYFQ